MDRHLPRLLGRDTRASARVACDRFLPEADHAQVLHEFLADATLQPGWGTPDPSPEKLRRWAYREDAGEPVVDFDLRVAKRSNAALMLELSNDDACPQRAFFLGCLYLLVGDAVRTQFRAHPRAFIDDLLAQASRLEPRCYAVAVWCERSEALLAAPESFDYELWCDGGHAQG